MGASGSMAQLPPIPPNIASKAAATLIGSLVNYCLYGVLGVQVYIYHYSFPEDKTWIKSLVYSVFTIETIQVCFNGSDVFHWFAAGFGNLVMLNQVWFFPFDTFILGAIIASIVQVFFAYRIWYLNKSYLWMSVIICLVSILQAIGGLVGGVIKFHNKFLSVPVSVPADLWLIGGAVADILIAVTMTILLLRTREETHPMSHTIVTRIVRLTVQSNSLTAGMALLALILYMGIPHTNYFTAPTIFLGKLYSNTLLATFNHRIFLRKENEKRSQRSLQDSVPSSHNQPYSPTPDNSYKPHHYVPVSIEAAKEHVSSELRRK
ncbi:hypothetical protein APHAL10511_001451 [Amanita phalloides]|nr:hypothetical protein APHAL10511_001451 [Amanita phalloides]